MRSRDNSTDECHIRWQTVANCHSLPLLPKPVIRALWAGLIEPPSTEWTFRETMLLGQEGEINLWPSVENIQVWFPHELELEAAMLCNLRCCHIVLID